MSDDNQADGKAEMNAADEREDLISEIADLRARLAAVLALCEHHRADLVGDGGAFLAEVRAAALAAVEREA